GDDLLVDQAVEQGGGLVGSERGRGGRRGRSGVSGHDTAPWLAVAVAVAVAAAVAAAMAGGGVIAASRAWRISWSRSCCCMAGCSSRWASTLSRPWPSLAPSYEYQVPDFSMTPSFSAVSTSSPSLLTPVPYRISKSASRNGGASLFLTTLTRTSLPTTTSPCLSGFFLRMSSRTEQ